MTKRKETTWKCDGDCSDAVAHANYCGVQVVNACYCERPRVAKARSRKPKKRGKKK